MKPAPFDYHAPTTVAEAVALLDSIEDSKALAGGQSLMPMLNMRLAQPSALVDLNGLSELDYIRRDDGHLAVGALTRQRALETDEQTLQDVPPLGAVLLHTGHVTIRNRGTVGGSLAHADPAAELPLAAATLEAQLVLAGPAGKRTVTADDFFGGFLLTAVEPNEVLTEVRFPVPPAGLGVGFEEVARRHGDFALVAVLSAVVLDGNGRVSWARVGVGGAHPVPLRVREAEERLLGDVPSQDTIAAAADAVAEQVQPTWDVHASADYRRRVACVLTRRTLGQAIERAGGR
jgi:carbon-monoxide dehydrogenase medium subunit